MLVTCFSTARSVTTSRPAIPAFDRPSAISSRTSRSRGVSESIGSVPRRRPTSCETIADLTGTNIDGKVRLVARSRPGVVPQVTEALTLDLDPVSQHMVGRRGGAPFWAAPFQRRHDGACAVRPGS